MHLEKLELSVISHAIGITLMLTRLKLTQMMQQSASVQKLLRKLSLLTYLENVLNAMESLMPHMILLVQPVNVLLLLNLTLLMMDYHVLKIAVLMKRLLVPPKNAVVKLLTLS